jgi:hypothetical protein
VLRVSTTHYNSERRHRGLALPPPDPARAANPPPVGKIERRDRQGGLIHEYRASSVNPGFETPHQGGRIWAENRPGGDARISFTLPAV